jgi:hypothetical protein
MQAAENSTLSASTVNYDESPIAEAEIDGIEYRMDAGHGSAVAISSREAGTWTWMPLGEGRWDGVQLRCRGLDFPLRERLARALAAVTSVREDGFS